MQTYFVQTEYLGAFRQWNVWPILYLCCPATQFLGLLLGPGEPDWLQKKGSSGLLGCLQSESKTQNLSVALIACGMITLHRFANLALPRVLSSLNLLSGLRASNISSHCHSANTLLCGPLLFRCFKAKDMNVCKGTDMDLGAAIRAPQEVCGVGGYSEAHRSLLASASQPVHSRWFS